MYTREWTGSVKCCAALTLTQRLRSRSNRERPYRGTNDDHDIHLLANTRGAVIRGPPKAHAGAVRAPRRAADARARAVLAAELLIGAAGGDCDGEGGGPAHALHRGTQRRGGAGLRVQHQGVESHSGPPAAKRDAEWGESAARGGSGGCCSACMHEVPSESKGVLFHLWIGGREGGGASGRAHVYTDVS